MRIVLDTNVMVSGFLSPNGPPGQLLTAWRNEVFRLVTSTSQLADLKRVLRYQHLQSRFAPEDIAGFFKNLPAGADVIEKTLPLYPLSADPDDNQIIATAMTGLADVIVSGDTKHLLVLGRVHGIPIVTPAQAMERLRASQ